MKRIILLLAAALAFIYAPAQTVREQLQANPDRYGGSSAPYELIRQGYTAPPKGYRPFYISHFGRHGSRFHTSGDMVMKLYGRFQKADSLGILTPLGKDVYGRVELAVTTMKGRWGDLSDQGAGEHRQIASRMYKNYKKVFKDGRRIVAVSTTSPRVILSMAAFCESLKEQDPGLVITREAGDRTGAYLNHYTSEYKEYYNNGGWRPLRDEWISSRFDPTRVTSSLFTAPSVLHGSFSGSGARGFAMDLYSLGKILKASGIDATLYDIFTEEELYLLWQNGNMDQYLRKGPSALGGELALSISSPLLKDFVDKADEAIAKREVCADLRFGHGEGIMPLSGLMGIKEASQVTADLDSVAVTWQDWRITTMGSNIQWIFYENRRHDIIVKILLNERESEIPVKTDMWPYYKWEDLKAWALSRSSR